MANKIRQFRYYGENNSLNYPSSLTGIQLISGAAFQDCYPISQLGIQSVPGTKFYLNGDKFPIIIGASGIYDLDIKNGFRITQLQFAKEWIEKIENNNYMLIVDILYKGKES